MAYMQRSTFSPILFLVTGFGWLVLSSLLGLAVYIGIIRGTPLPTWLRLVHVHGALVGGVAQVILGAMLAFIPPLLMTGGKRPHSHPILYGAINVGAIGMLTGFALNQYVLIGGAGLLVLAPFLSLASDALKQARQSLSSPPLNLLFYGLAIAALLIGLTIGELLGFRVLGVWYGQARLAHIHLNLLGFVTLTIVGTMHNLLPTIVQAPLHSIRLARVVFVLVPAGLIALLTGFALSSVRIEIAAGGLLLLATVLYGYNMFRTWLDAGQPSRAASDHLLAATAFLVLAIAAGMLVGVNALWDPPYLPFGTLHLVAYTHAALVGFILQTIIGALSHLLPTALAVSRVSSNKKRSPYWDALNKTIDRWRSVQIISLSLGTLGLSVVASLTWSQPLNSPVIHTTMWISLGLLLLSLVLFSGKVTHILGTYPTDE